jgi:hypothetical protein
MNEYFVKVNQFYLKFEILFRPIHIFDPAIAYFSDRSWRHQAVCAFGGDFTPFLQVRRMRGAEGA